MGLSKTENDRYTQVGPGTPMGELFRRYWMPVAPSIELQEDPVKQVRILGETLVLFRDRQGRLGLVGERCSHRGTALVYGIPEPEGLRCAYHGSLYDQSGRCLAGAGDTPTTSEEAEAYAIPAYPVQELGGLIFAYLGPQPAPLLPRWEQLVEERVLRSIQSVVVPCNWLQCMENALDERHVSWLHGYFGNYMLERQGRDQSGAERPHRKFSWVPFEYGMLRGHQGSDGGPLSPVIFPNCSPGGRGSMIFRVPLDDTHTWSIDYFGHRFPPEVEVPAQETVPVHYLEVPGLDPRGHPIWPDLDVTGMQDMVMWMARGTIADRSTEELGEGEEGIILYRQLVEENMRRIERGEDPIGVIRDPAKNVCIRIGNDLENDKRIESTRGGGSARRGDRHDPVVAQIRELVASAASPA